MINCRGTTLITVIIYLFLLSAHQVQATDARITDTSNVTTYVTNFALIEYIYDNIPDGKINYYDIYLKQGDSFLTIPFEKIKKIESNNDSGILITRVTSITGNTIEGLLTRRETGRYRDGWDFVGNNSEFGQLALLPGKVKTIIPEQETVSEDRISSLLSELQPNELGNEFNQSSNGTGRRLPRSNFNSAYYEAPNEWITSSFAYNSMEIPEELGKNLESSIDYSRIFEELQKGNKYFDKGDYGQALTYFNKAINFMDPDLATIWYNKGNALLKLKKYDEAINNYATAIEIKPGFSQAWNNKGIALILTGHDREGKEARLKAKELQGGL